MTGDISSLSQPVDRLTRVLEKFYRLALYSVVARYGYDPIPPEERVTVRAELDVYSRGNTQL